MRYSIVIVLFLTCGISYSFAQQPEWKQTYDDPHVVRELFEEPPLFYAPHTFWFWDDTIRNEYFPASMAEEMAMQRLNPGYAHPRSSMNRLDPRYPSLPYAQYLEAPWFNGFRNALDKAKTSGLTLGYCDDYGWPSGQAAGRVLEQRPDLEARHLDWKRVEVTGGATLRYDSVGFVVAAQLIDGVLDASTLQLIGVGKANWNVPAGRWVVYTYTEKFHLGADGGRVNYLHPELMDTFIPLIHERYEQELGAEFGQAIPGVFVDHEGDYGWHIAWSDYLAELYQKKKNRDIRLWLPMLTEKDRDGLYVKARNDWFDVVSDAYIHCFFEPVVDWLAQRDMYAISNLWEESLQAQTSMVGDLMRITRAVSMPGNDCLVMKSQEVHDFKEVQTVAEFEGRPFMSEIMGVAGWEQSPQMMKMTINSITSFGVSHVVPHGIYLNRAIETIPFPADWYTENPFWPYLHQWTDFSRRAAFVTRQTQLVADVLLFQPMESIWAEAEGMFYHREDPSYADNPDVWSDAAREVNTVYADAMKHLNSNNIEFLIADKHYLDTANLVMEAGRPVLDIQDHRFSAIVLPPVTVMSRSSSQKILEFAQQGGTVVLLGRLPSGSPEIGKVDPIIIEAMRALREIPQVIDLSASPQSRETLAGVLHDRIGSRVRLQGAGRLYTTHRKIDNTHFYWLANNTDTTRHFEASFRNGEGAAEIWNCETGTVSSVDFSLAGDYRKLDLTLEPYEAYWVVFNPDGQRTDPVAAPSLISEELVDGHWRISYPETDTVYRTSAKARFTATGSGYTDAMAKTDAKLDWQRSSFIKGSLEQTVLSDNHKTKKAVETLADLQVWWRLIVPIGAKSIIFPKEMLGTTIWVDGVETVVSNQTLMLAKETNMLAFTATKDEQLPTTPIGFVVGREISQPLNTWYGYGLDQYTGYLDYEKTFVLDDDHTKLVLDLAQVDYMAEVFVNGKSVGARLWPPYRFDLSDVMEKGENTLKVRIGNLMVNHMSLMDDTHRLRTWSWGFSPEPDLDQYDSGMTGPIKLMRYE